MFRVYLNLNNRAPEIAAINLGQWHPYDIHKPLHFAMESRSVSNNWLSSCVRIMTSGLVDLNIRIPHVLLEEVGELLRVLYHPARL